MDPPILGRYEEWEESEHQKPGSDLEMGVGGPCGKSSGVGVGIHTVLLVQEEEATEEGIRVLGDTLNWAHLWIRDAGAKTPCFGEQVKYRTPKTEPSCLPVGWSSSIPYQ